ncbi:MAG: flagellar biosynthesis anti-sigma factor FlgM [Methylococcales bacterium]|jgi:negative regulator of flagellin synthesis FlgM|nr:flagellar biosynthesis anti-sigma factor FlgM [Methylococcales bacterium]MBT7411158.1 flagellar biosynthesis anti-sigma factor FlgM [Methylococcales bacterium]
MSIDATGSAPRVVPQYNNEKTGSTNSTEQKTKQSNVADSDFNMTGTAKTLQTLEHTIGQLQDVDSEKIAKLREQIVQGQYTVDPERIANKMIEFESSFL